MRTIDVIGIGIGPFNLSLAALLEPVNELTSLFFESQNIFNWHPGLLLEDCTLQVPMMADLVTMADPTSQYSYMNYLHQTGRLYQFYFYEDFLIPRNDYNRYCQWVSQQLKTLLFSHTVTAISPHEKGYQVRVINNLTQQEQSYIAKKIVLGTGSIPNIPNTLEHCSTLDNCLHSSQYLHQKNDLQKSQSITVVGAGQSAAEIVLDLLNEQIDHHYEINWLTQSDGFLPMEYSKLGLEHFSPDYIDHFYTLEQDQKDNIRAKQHLWYKGISAKTIADIYDRIYRRSIHQRPAITLQARSELLRVEKSHTQLKLTFEHRDNKQQFNLTTDKLVLSTGYKYSSPPCLEPLDKLLKRDDQGRLIINRNYSIAMLCSQPENIYIQNGEIHSHGIGAPDLGLGAYRSAFIINDLLQREHYTLSSNNVFQHFGIAPQWQPSPSPQTPFMEPS